MEFKEFKKYYVMRVDKGEEIVQTLKQFCEVQGIRLGKVTGIGAVNKATIGFFDTDTKQYHSIELKGDHEITSLMGNISTMNGEVYLHLHANISDTKYNTYGGHLNAAVVSATAEIMIEAIDGEVDRAFSDEIGLNLYKFNK